jgi:trigger factor
MYEKSVIAEEMNKLLTEKVYDYIKANDIKIVGEPLPDEKKQEELDFNTAEEFEFLFDLALVPEFTVELTDKDEIDYYTIDVNDEMVNSEIERYTQRYGKYEKVDSYQDKDMLEGLLTELDENGNAKEGGLQVENSVFMPMVLKNEEQKVIFTGAKVNDVLIFNLHTAYGDNHAELASLLKIEKEAASTVKSDFSFQVNEITRYLPSELNQEFFDTIYGKGNVNSEEEFRVRVKESLITQYALDSQYKFNLDVRKILLEKVGGDLTFSETLLKRIIQLNVKDKDEKSINEEYEKSIEILKWQLIKGQLAKKYDIKIEEDDISNAAKNSARTQFAHYGMATVPDDIIDKYTDSMLKKKETVNQLADQTIEEKLITVLKEQVKLNNKTVSLEEFTKMLA